MSVRSVIRLGHPVLRQRSQSLFVDEMRSKETADLIQDLRDTMQACSGLGIAAPQINVSKQVVIIKIPENNERYGSLEASEEFVLINPVINTLNGPTQGYWEGCLSVPGLRGYVNRPSNITVDYYNQHGLLCSKVISGFLATVFQHEIDHLQGKLFVDRVLDTRLLTFSEEYD